MQFTAWDQTLTTKQTDLVLLGLAQWHLQQCSTNLIEAGQAIALGDVLRLGRMSVPTWLSANDFYHHRQIKAFFQKRKDLTDPAVDKQAVAWKAFVQAEELCRQTNTLFRLRAEGKYQFSPRVESVLHNSQRKIARILGDVPRLCDIFLRFGPGATTLTKKKNASARRKLSSMFACSENSLGIVADILEEMPAWTTTDGSEESTFVDVLVTDDVIEFAPKTFETHRTIAKTSVVTGMVQLGVGDLMAERLRTEGVDIRDQSRNQRLARIGSIGGALGTADLTNASNCVSRLLVMDLFPYEWYDLLVRLTSTYVITPSGDRLATEMFSTMGNGFTFPVETLIFYALAKSACEEVGAPTENVAVYGDDIVCPVEAYQLLAETLTATGFMLNTAKSFFSGPFRESCGCDWYLGEDVRPCFVKGPLSGASLFVLHNFYRRRGLTEPAMRLVELVHPSIRLYGPDGFGDGHLLGDFSLTAHKRDAGWSGYTFETFTWLPKRVYYELGADYVFPSYSIYVKDRSLTDEDQKSYLELVKARDTARKLRLPPSLATSVHGDLRPERSDAIYRQVKGKWRLADTIPGVEGYKRIRIYTTKDPLTLSSHAAAYKADEDCEASRD